MSNLVFVSGGFSSGTTVLFTLFRRTGDYYCLYEPLHEKLLEYLIYPLRPDVHHRFVKPYYDEYKGFSKIPELFEPQWGNSQLHLAAHERADRQLRYWRYLIETAQGRRGRVMLKDNRLTFRLGWLKANFPNAKIVHIYRDKTKQWNSIVRRGQEYFGREDIGQDSVRFNGFSLDSWCEDLKSVFGELDAGNSSSGYERFSKLWDLSFAEHRKFADISVDLRELTHDFEATCGAIGACVEYDFDVSSLKPYVLASERTPATLGKRTLGDRVRDAVDSVGRRYARARLRIRSEMRGHAGRAASE